MIFIKKKSSLLDVLNHRWGLPEDEIVDFEYQLSWQKQQLIMAKQNLITAKENLINSSRILSTVYSNPSNKPVFNILV